jgi:D-alanine-D-alanine ligase
MITVGILCGGKSAEHEVSLQSAHNVYEALDREKYCPVLIGIDKSGHWFLGNTERFLLDADDPNRIRLGELSSPAALVPEQGGAVASVGTLLPDRAVDVIFPILHGPYGEDGTVQGLLKLADVPFVGTGVLGSAVGMDKDIMKRLLRDAGIPIGTFMVLMSYQAVPNFASVVDQLGLPFFIKPANMGSSVGVSKIRSEHEYSAGLNRAFEYDNKIVIEEFIPGREIECSVLGMEIPIASVPGEVLCSHEFYSYEAKYVDEQGAVLVIPAQLAPETVARIQALAIKTFQVLCAEGLSRVDFFLRSDGSIVVNEINTMPGFTKISMYPKLFEASGITYPQLIDRLIELAIQRFEKEKKLKTSYL